MCSSVLKLWALMLGVALSAVAHGQEEAADVGRTSLFLWSGQAADANVGRNDDGPLATDRPDFTEASTVVGMGRVQLEMGYTYVQEASAGTVERGHSYPETLLRVGMLAEWFEFRIAYNYAQQTSSDMPGLTMRGSEDIYLGAKFKLTEQEGVLPEMVLLPQMTVPTGSADFSANKVLPGVNWLYGWDVNDLIGIGGSTQFNRAVDDTSEFYTEWAQSFTVVLSLSDNLSQYTEWFTFIPAGASDASVGVEHYLDGGFAYLLTDDIQVDIRAGVGLNARSDNFFSGAGISMRF